MTARVKLAAVLSPALVEAIEAVIDERVADAVAQLGEPSSPWYSLDAAAAYLSVSRRTIEREISRGRLHTYPVGRRCLIHRHELDRLAAGEGGDSANRSTSPAAAT